MKKPKKIFEGQTPELKTEAAPQPGTAKAAEPSTPPAGAIAIQINAQYIKDLSFENPHNPIALMQVQEKPGINVGVDVQAKALGENRFEVELRFSAKATAAEKTLYLVELTYAGIFTLQNVPQNQLEPTLLVYCPSMLFPFARRIIADTTRDGCLQPLWLDPVDFGRLYSQRKQQNA